MEAYADAAHWDAQWDSITLPIEVRRTNESTLSNAILDPLDRHLPRGSHLSALEIGGAPGGYLAYMHRTYGYGVTCVDYSKRGIEKTERNFELLGISGRVIQADVFSDALDIGSFDIVYSLGFIEHFSNLVDVVRAHVRLGKPGGYLAVGMPNLLGVNGFFLERFAPKLMAKHNLATMEPGAWDAFERTLRLEVLFRGHIGGFDPTVFSRVRDVDAPEHLALGLFARGLERATRGRRALRRFNHRLFSGYLLGIYRIPLLAKTEMTQ